MQNFVILRLQKKKKDLVFFPSANKLQVAVNGLTIRSSSCSFVFCACFVSWQWSVLSVLSLAAPQRLNWRPGEHLAGGRESQHLVLLMWGQETSLITKNQKGELILLPGHWEGGCSIGEGTLGSESRRGDRSVWWIIYTHSVSPLVSLFVTLFFPFFFLTWCLPRRELRNLKYLDLLVSKPPLAGWGSLVAPLTVTNWHWVNAPLHTSNLSSETASFIYLSLTDRKSVV